MKSLLIFGTSCVVSLLLLTCSTSAATYYIDFTAANDAANGTSRNTPWKHHPYMNGWKGSYTHSAGDRFIFKGGVTWDSTCFKMNVNYGGTAGNPDYYGVDKTWYTGGSWTRPIFNNQWAHKSIIWVRSPYVTYDNIETKNITFTSADYGICMYQFDGAFNGITIKNCLLHGWVITDPQKKVNPECGGILCGSDSCTYRSTLVDSCEIHNMEYSGTPNGYKDSLGVLNCGSAIYGINTISNSSIYDLSNAIVHCKVIHHCTIHNICYPVDCFNAPISHTNVLEPDGDTVRVHHNYIYNNKSLSVLIDSPCWSPVGIKGSYIAYWYNNVVVSPPGFWVDFEVTMNHWQNDSINDTCGSENIYNNTFASTGSQSQWIYVAQWNYQGKNPKKALKYLNIKNNQYICTDSSNTYNFASLIVNKMVSNNYWMAPATAAKYGCTVADSFAPKQTPPSVMKTGENLHLLFTDDYRGFPRPASGPWYIGAYEYSGLDGTYKPDSLGKKH